MGNNMLLLMSKDEKAAFLKAAELRGLKLHGYIKHVLRSAAIKELTEHGKPIDFFTDNKTTL